MSGNVRINLQTGQASGDVCATPSAPAGLQLDAISGQTSALVPAVQTCAPAGGCEAGGGSGVGVVLQGVQGPVGPAGGLNDFTQTFASAASTWTVNHNLGREPAIQVLSVGGVEMIADVVHISANQAQVYFATPTAGRVRAV